MKRGGRGGKKPSVAKAKRVVTKVRKSKAKRNMDTFFLKAKTVSTIVPAQGVAVANYVYWASTLDPTSSPAGNNQFLTNAEFKLYSQMYDKFRINKVTMKIVPKANVSDIAINQLDTNYNLTGDGMVHTCIDRDGLAPSNIAAISRYPSYKKFSVLKTWSRSYSIRYPTGVWLDCQSPASFTMAKELGLTGGITLYAENFLEDNYEIFNEPWAQVEHSYDIVFQGKTSASLTAVSDASGNVIGVSVVNNPAVPNLPPTVPTNIRGTLSKDTRTHDEVTENPITDQGNA